MERSEAIYLFEDSKNRIKWFLKDIDEDINGSNRLVFKGKVSVQLYDIAENVGKVVNYIRDGKRDADRLKSELLSLRSMVKELQSKTLQKGYEHFAYNCDMTISIIDNMEKWETDAPIPETDNKKLIDGEKDTPKEKTLTRDEIIECLKDIEPFEALNPDEPINYKEYYKRLCDGGVIDSQYGLDLFTYCVERADISKIIAKPEKKKDNKKSYARLFMNDVASVFSIAADYRKAAAKAFILGDNTHIGSVGGDVKTEYQELMKGLFKTNWQKKR